MPFIVVFGEKEKKGKLSVRARDGKQEQLTAKELAALIAGEVGDKPFRPLPLPPDSTEWRSVYATMAIATTWSGTRT